MDHGDMGGGHGHGDMDMGDQCSMNASLQQAHTYYQELTGADALYLVVQRPMYRISPMACHQYFLTHPLSDRHRPPHRGLRMHTRGQQKI